MPAPTLTQRRTQQSIICKTNESVSSRQRRYQNAGRSNQDFSPYMRSRRSPAMPPSRPPTGLFVIIPRWSRHHSRGASPLRRRCHPYCSKCGGPFGRPGNGRHEWRPYVWRQQLRIAINDRPNVKRGGPFGPSRQRAS